MSSTLVTEARPTNRLRRVDAALLWCGVAYAATYVVVNDLVAARTFEGYDPWDQAVSELSAKGADPRTLLVAMLPVWSGLMAAFGIGIWRAAGERRPLRVAGAVFVAHAVVAVGWLWFPMTPRAEMALTGSGSNDAGHLVMTSLTITFIVAELVSGGLAFGRRFRLYTALTGVAVLLFGSLVGTLSSRLTEGQPTPLLGFYERISIGVWLLWMSVLAVRLLRERHAAEAPQVRRR